MADKTLMTALFFRPFMPFIYSRGRFTILWTRDEAEMEYLKIAQDLEMYGVNYFFIRVRWLSHLAVSLGRVSEPLSEGVEGAGAAAVRLCGNECAVRPRVVPIHLH